MVGQPSPKLEPREDDGLEVAPGGKVKLPLPRRSKTTTGALGVGGSIWGTVAGYISHKSEDQSRTAANRFVDVQAQEYAEQRGEDPTRKIPLFRKRRVGQPGRSSTDEGGPMPSAHPDPSASPQVRTKTNPTPLDVIFILSASVALVVLILSFSAVRGAEPFQNIPHWLVRAVSNFWNRLFVGAGTLGSLALRKWLDHSPAPNYLVWISVFTVGLLGAVLFSAALVIPPPMTILTATIDEPKKDRIVTRRTFICKGHASGVGPDTHLWLVVEVNNRVWPKERELHVLADGRWESTVYEDGATDKFSLSVYNANAQGEKFINDWIEAGKKTGEYKELKGIPDTERITRVDDLRLKAK